MKLYGSPHLRVLPGSSIAVDKKGLVTGTVKYQVPKDRTHLFPKRNSGHPFRGGMTMESYTINYGPVFATMSGRYVGLNADDLDGEGNTEAVYSLQVGTSTEPIETHPLFRQFAGTPQSPKNGAVFVDGKGNPIVPSGGMPSSWEGNDDGAGMYLEGSILKGAVLEPSSDQAAQTSDEDNKNNGPTIASFDKFVASEKAGVTSYLDANNVIWRESWSGTAIPSTGGGEIGKISTPAGPVPNFAPRNWLYVGLTFEVKGSFKWGGNENGGQQKVQHVYSISREWKLSGRRGWDQDIYG